MVEFISYTGRYPNFCSGVLTLKIDGEEVTFGKWNDNADYSSFWESGGGLDRDYEPYHAPWIIDAEAIPEKYRKYAKDIGQVFNANVPFGCCGGCG